jgi:hypothetical protein
LVYLNTIFHWCKNWMVIWHEAKQKYLVLLTKFNLSLWLWEISLPRTKCKSPSLIIWFLPLMSSNKIMYKVKFIVYDYPIININNKDNFNFSISVYLTQMLGFDAILWKLLESKYMSWHWYHAWDDWCNSWLDFNHLQKIWRLEGFSKPSKVHSQINEA